MGRNHRKYTKRHLYSSHDFRRRKRKNILNNELLKFIFYSIIGAIIFLLIYSIWFNPGYTETIIENIQEGARSAFSSSNSSLPVNAVRLVPSEMEEYGLWQTFNQRCSQVEAIGESEGIYDIKRKVCREACGFKEMEYSSNDCEIDLLVCYCKI